MKEYLKGLSEKIILPSNSALKSIFLITLGKQMSSNYAPYFNKINFAVIPSYVEVPFKH